MMRNFPEFTSRGLALLTVCLSAWFFGGVLPETQLWMARAFTVCVLLSVFTRESLHLVRVALPAVLLLLMAALGLGGLQLIQWGPEVIDAISPHTVAITQQFTGGVNDQSLSLSIAPYETRRMMALLVVAIAAFYVGCLMFQTVRSQLVLCSCLAFNGVLLSVWGMIQQASAFPVLLPGTPAPERIGFFSTWFNHSSAAGYLNMSLGAAMGLLLYTYRNADLRMTRLSDGVRAVCQNVLTAPTLASGIAALTLVVGVTASLSRGAYISTTLAFVVLFVLLAVGHKRFGSISFALLATIVLISVVGWVGMGERVTKRLTTLTDGALVEDSRWGHWRDGVQVFENFPIVGTGLGTYQRSYLAFEQSTFDRWFQHAHNQYLETAADAGVIGLCLLAGLLLLTCQALWRIRSKKSAILHHWFALAMSFVIVSQVIHAISDFGLYHPANMVAMALMCGSLCGTAAVFSTDGWSRLLRIPRVISYPIVWGPVCFVLCVIGTAELRAYALSDSICINANQPQSVEEYEQRLLATGRALQSSPDDANLHLSMTDTLIDRFEFKTRAILQTANAELTEEELEAATSLIQLHRRIVEGSAQSSALATSVQTVLQPAWDHAIEARSHSPLLPRAHYRIAQLSPVFDPTDSESLGRAAQLSASDADMNFKLGLLHLHRSEFDLAAIRWHRCLTLSTEYFERIIVAALPKIPAAVIAKDILPSDPLLSIQVAARLGQTPAQVRLRIATANHVIESIGASDDVDEADYQYAMAAAHMMISRDDLAAQHMHNAVLSRPNELDWRFEYSVLLWQLGENDEARKQLQWCLRLRPHVQRFRQLMQEIDESLQTVSR